MKFCPECGIGLCTAEQTIGYCKNCHFDFQDLITIERSEWNGYCRCGHNHSEHNSINSVNYSAGRCTIGECRCRYFIHEPSFTEVFIDELRKSVAANKKS